MVSSQKARILLHRLGYKSNSLMTSSFDYRTSVKVKIASKPYERPQLY